MRSPEIVCILICAACTPIQTKTPEGESVSMSEEQFSSYVEHVFRHHNSVVDESLFISPGGLDSKNDPLLNAEMKMHHACQPLNELVSLTAAGQKPDIWLEMKLADAVPECESATRNLEKLISQDKK